MKSALSVSATTPIAVIALFAGPLTAATWVQPPSEILTRNENSAVVVEAIGSGESGAGETVTYRFKTRKVLHGEAEPVLRVRMEAETMDRIEPGARYVLGYTDLLPVPLQKKTFTSDPQGPRIIDMDDAGPALVEDTKAVRRLIATAKSTDPRDAERDVKLILRQMDDDQPAALRFVAAELHLRRGLSEKLTSDAGEALDAAWRRAADDPLARYHLLSVTEKQVAVLGPDRVARYAREVLDSHGARLELASYRPLLILTAARALGPVGLNDDLLRLERHLYSNNTGIPKVALPSMAAIDPEATLEAVNRALALEDLNPETRRVLNAYLREAGRGKDPAGG